MLKVDVLIFTHRCSSLWNRKKGERHISTYQYIHVVNKTVSSKKVVGHTDSMGFHRVTLCIVKVTDIVVIKVTNSTSGRVSHEKTLVLILGKCSVNNGLMGMSRGLENRDVESSLVKGRRSLRMSCLRSEVHFIFLERCVASIAICWIFPNYLHTVFQE